MKILFITDNFLPHIGGSRIIFYNICKRLPKDAVCVVTKYVSGGEYFDKKQQFKIYRIPLFALPKKLFWFFYEVPLYLSLFLGALVAVLKERPAVLCAGEALPCGLIAMIFKKIFKIPYMVFTFAEDITIASKLRTEKKVLWSVLRNAKKIISTCSFIDDFIIQQGMIARTRVSKIYPGIDDEIIDFKADQQQLALLREKTGSNNKKIIFTCARLIGRKGIDTVIKAMPVVLAQIPEVVYFIAGEGPEQKRLERLIAEYNLLQKVKFLGALDHYRDLPYYYALCDVFVMPSRQLNNFDIEGFGLVFLEANAFAKPVVGPAYGGPKDAIIDGKTGFAVDPSDTAAVAQALIKLLSDNNLAQQLGENGRMRVGSEFRWQDKADEFFRIAVQAAGANKEKKQL